VRILRLVKSRASASPGRDEAKGPGRTLRVSAVVLAALLAALAITACGGGSSSSSSSSEESGSSTSAEETGGAGGSGESSSEPSGEPWKVGVMGTTTGPGASAVGSMVPTLEAWEQWTNAHGGIAGKPVEVLAENAPDPATSNAAVRKLIGQDHVVAIIAANGSTAAWGPYVEGQNIPIIGMWGEPTVTSNVYDAGSNYEYSANVSLPIIAHRAGIEKIAVAYCAEYPACAEIPDLFKTYGKENGLTVVSTSSVSGTSTSYAPACLAAQEAGADGLYPGAVSEVQVHLIEDCAQQNFTPQYITGKMNPDASWLKTSATEGVVGSTGTMPWMLETPGLKEMHEALEQYEPDVMSSENYGTSTGTAWTQGAAFKKAAELGGKQTPDGIVEGLMKFKEETLGGLAAPITYAEGDDPNKDLNCFFEIKIENGEWTAPEGEKPICKNG
jgi:branched-chain amino acid transport system substrate-binding protein